MAQAPSMDPSAPERAAPETRRNRAITDGYEPGSTLKLVAAAAALESGRFEAATPVACHGGELEVDGEVFHDPHPYDELSLQDVFAKSSNLGMISVALDLGPRPFYAMARRFGFGHETGLGFPGEAKGILREPTAWSARSLPTLAIGQEVLVTPLQLACAYAAVANGGRLVPPKIVRYVMSPDGEIREPPLPAAGRQVISEDTAHQLLDFCGCVWSRVRGARRAWRGWRSAARLAPPRRVSGTVRATLTGWPWLRSWVLSRLRPLGLVGLIVIDEPREPAWGGTVAAPAFRRIVQRIIALDGVARTHLSEVAWPASEAEASSDRREQWLGLGML